MKRIIINGILLFSGLICFEYAQAQSLTGNFYAYHTKLNHTSTDYFGKYADLIVVLGQGKQLEFTRQTNYVPRWVTPSGTYLMDEFFPDQMVLQLRPCIFGQTVSVIMSGRNQWQFSDVTNILNK